MSSTIRSEPHKPPATGSVALRLTAWYVGSSSIILLVATLALYLILIGNLRREQDQFLDDKIAVIRDLLSRRPEDIDDLKEEVEQNWAPRQYAQVYARVISEDGRVIVESPGMGTRLEPNAFPQPGPLDAPTGQGVSLIAKSGNSVRAMTVRASIGPDAEETGVLQVALDTGLAADLLAGYRRTLLLVLGVGLASCGVTGYLVARRGLKPLREISATAQRISSSNLNERIDVAGLPAELSILATRFNAMLERLQDSFDRLSRFSADIAHELRTPVNNMRIEVEVALGRARSVDEYRDTLESCLEEYGRLSRLIDAMLFIARAENPRTQIAKEPVDVNRELERVREFFELPAAEAGIQLMVNCPPETVAEMDRTLFQRAVSNLVGNAIRYTPQGGRVAIAANRQNGELHVEVSDTGRGIAAEDLPHVFDRFFRADPARSTASGNVGLGLAIVKSIVSLHGGTIAVQSRPASGTCVSIRLPAEIPPRPVGPDHPA
jgi:two-component system heavy metal sensor histidine kinase CusS